MDTRTGELHSIPAGVTAEDFAQQRGIPRGCLVEVKRDLSRVEEASRQIRMYAPCGCGSGKKFKFCCFKKGNT